MISSTFFSWQQIKPHGFVLHGRRVNKCIEKGVGVTTDGLLERNLRTSAISNRPMPFLLQADGELRDCGADGEAGLEQDGGGQLGRRRQHRRVPAGGQDRRVQVSHLRRFSRN